MIPGATAISDVAISALPELEGDFLVTVAMDAEVGGETKFYAATAPFATLAADEPTEQFFPATLRKNFSFSRDIQFAGGFGGVTTSLGALELDNTEGDYDDLETDFSVDGGRVLIKVGEVENGRADYASFYTVADLIAARKSADETTFRLMLIDKSFKLDVPAVSAVYGGTGNLDGGTEVAGKRKPWALGWVTGATPAPVIPAESVYAVSWRAVQSISAIYDTGVPYTIDADYATSDLMRAATVVPGHAVTCIAEGLFRLGGTAFGPVTADVEGDNVGGFVETTAAIVRRLALIGAELEASEIAENAFDRLDLDQPAPVNYFISHTSDKTVAQVVGKLMAGIDGYAGFSLRFAQLEVGLFAAPSFIAAADYNEVHVLGISREPLPDEINPPPYRRRCTYARNWTPLSTVAGEITDQDRIAYLQSDGKIATTAEADVADILEDHPLATDPEPVQSYFRDEADAQAFVDGLLDLFADSPGQYRTRLHSHPFVHEIGETIKLTKPRFDLTDGKLVTIVSVKDDIGEEGGIQDVVGVG